MKKFIYPMLTFVLAAGGACAAQSDQPSLGDLAKQNRQGKKVVKVLTNDDVATVKPEKPQAMNAGNASPAMSGASEATVKSPEKTKDAETAASKPNSASKDTPEVAALKQKLTSYREEQDGWKKSAKKYEDLMANETSNFRRQMYEEALEGDKQNVEHFQQKIDQTEADLSKAEKSSSSSH